MGKGRLELPRPGAHDPKSCLSANSSTSPWVESGDILTDCITFCLPLFLKMLTTFSLAGRFPFFAWEGYERLSPRSPANCLCSWPPKKCFYKLNSGCHPFFKAKNNIMSKMQLIALIMLRYRLQPEGYGNLHENIAHGII